MDDKTILLKIELDTTSLTAGAKQAEENLKKLTPELQRVATESGKNTLEYKKLNAEVKANQKTLTDNATALQKYEALQKSNNGSLKEMRNLLSASKVAYAELTKEERENVNVGGKLVKEMDDLNNQLLESEKAYGTHTRNVGNYAGALTDLKAEIKSLKGQMATMDAGSTEYQQAAKRAGELNDKLKEVNENTKANTGGTGFEKMSNNLGLVKDDLMNLDFQGVSEKMKQMAVISKSMTFGEAIGGLKNMGSALLSLGKAILANPLFLIVAAIVAIGAALKAWSDSVHQNAVKAQQDHTKSIEATINAMERQAKKSKEIRDLDIEYAKLTGKSTKEVGKMRLDDLRKQNEDQQMLLIQNSRKILSLQKEANIAEEEEDRNAIYDKIRDIRQSNKDIQDEISTYGKRRRNLQAEINKDVLEEETTTNEKRVSEEKSTNEKLKSESEKAYQDRIALARKIRDLQLGNLELSNDNERNAIEAHYKFLEDTAQGNADELLRIQGDKNNDLAKLDEKEKQERIKRIKETTKREIEDAGGLSSKIKENAQNQIEYTGEKTKVITEIEKQQKLQLDALDIEYKNKATERETAYTNKVTESQKQRAENEQKTADEIELIDAQLQLARAKGTDDERIAIFNLYAVKKKQLKEQAEREIKAGKDRLLVEKELQLKLQQLSDETFKNDEENTKKKVKLTKEEKKELAIQAVNAAGQLADSLMQISRNQIQQELNEDKDKYDSKLKLLQDQLDAGVISQANFNAQKSTLDAEYAQQEKELKKKQFESNKASQLINATIATAVGVASALNFPPPANLIMAGLAGALGAAQIAIIASQPTPKFAKGGLLQGLSHEQGGIKTQFGELEGGEAVINKRSTRMFAPLLSAINEAGGGVKFANGGVLQPMTNSINNSFQMQNAIIQAMQSLPSPIVAVEEIVNAVGRKTTVVERANF